MLTQKVIPYQTDSDMLFARLQHLPWAVWLDSQGVGDWDIMTAMPRTRLWWDSLGHPLCEGDVPPNWSIPTSPFAATQTLHAHMAAGIDTAALAHLPFRGGLLGYWGYGASEATWEPAAHALPAAAMGWYDWFIALDHRRGEGHLVFLESCPEATRLEVEACLAAPAPDIQHFRLTQLFAPETSRPTYARHIRRIQDYIVAGDCYQVNYTQAFTAAYEGSPWAAYQALRRGSASPFAAYLHYPFGDVLCLSPEQFISVKNGQIHSKPIKGTRPRVLDDAARDAQQAQELLASAKDRAENVMITDLLRNDIGRHAQTGSVKVDSLCALESFSLVHHLVSTISATLHTGSHPIELLRDAFPGGSITGAPKKRAMEIIAELEPTPRSVYCGAIGYINADGSLNTNIAIRTLACHDSQIRAWAGGGITIDSRWEDEYQECLNKIGGLIRTLETLR